MPAVSAVKREKSTFSRPVAYTLANHCCLIWAGAYVTGKMAIGTPDAPGFGPFRAACFRFAIAGIVLLLWGLWRNPESLRIAREDWPRFLRLAVLGMCLTYVFNYGGMEMTTGTAAALLMATEPVWIAILAAMFLKERLTFARSIGIVAGLAGTVLVILSTQPPGQIISFTGGAMPGNVLIVLSLLFESTAVLTVKDLTRRYKGMTVVTYDFLLGTVMLAPFAAVEMVQKGPIHPSPSAWWSFFYLVTACTIFAYTLWYRLLEDIDASELTVFIFLQPVIGTILGVFWKGDPFTMVTLLGAFFVLIGMGGILYESLKKKTVNDTVVTAEVFSVTE